MADAPALYRLVDLLSKKTPEFIGKHPVAVATTAGAGLGAYSMNRPADKLEGEMTQEYYNMPGAKYSSATLEKFAERKKFLDIKTSYEKTGGERGELPVELTIGLGAGAGREGLSAIRRLIGAAAQSIRERFISEPVRQNILYNAVMNDPDVKRLEELNPGVAMNTYATMKRFAPELSTDPNAVTAFLRHAAMTGGPIDHTMIKGLAEAETAIHKARNEGAWFSWS